MKLFMASLATETNTFAPMPTGRRAFEEFGLYRGDGSAHPDHAMFGGVLALWRTQGQRRQCEIVESLCAYAAPAGPVLREVYEEYRDIILADLRAALPVDVVLLCLHGAMVAQGYEDCEGDLLRRVREIVGKDTVIGAELDLHCHTTREKLRACDILICYKEYPHTDIDACAREVFDLCLRAAQGEIRPVTRAYDCNMTGLWRTSSGPAKALVTQMRQLEQSGKVLSISFGHGFPWADTPDVGAKVWAITDADAASAQHWADEFGEKAFASREAGHMPHMSIDAAIDRLQDAPAGLIVFADVADNPGIGAPADNTFILQRLLERNVRSAACGVFWDLTAVEICRNAGVGAELTLRIGGKAAALSGLPVDLTGTVQSIIEDHHPPGLGGRLTTLGVSVWFKSETIDVVLSSIRNQTFSPPMFEDHGLNLSERHVVVVKSTEHFYAEFASRAAEVIYVATPGVLRPDFENIPYVRRSAEFWPRHPRPRRGSFKF